MLTFFQDFWVFNQNAFLNILYFLYKHAWLILGLLSIGYIFFAEQFGESENEVKDERQIL